MIALTGKALAAIRSAAQEIGEDVVTIASHAGVITFDFSGGQHIKASVLPYESQPTRQELEALIGERPCITTT